VYDNTCWITMYKYIFVFISLKISSLLCILYTCYELLLLILLLTKSLLLTFNFGVTTIDVRVFLQNIVYTKFIQVSMARVKSLYTRIYRCYILTDSELFMSYTYILMNWDSWLLRTQYLSNVISIVLDCRFVRFIYFKIPSKNMQRSI